MLALYCFHLESNVHYEFAAKMMNEVISGVTTLFFFFTSAANEIYLE